MTPALRQHVGAHRSEVVVLVRDGWWPEGRPRPNLYDLAIRHGAAGFRERFLAVTGLDVRIGALPSFEQLAVFEALLGSAVR